MDGLGRSSEECFDTQIAQTAFVRVRASCPTRHSVVGWRADQDGHHGRLTPMHTQTRTV